MGYTSDFSGFCDLCGETFDQRDPRQSKSAIGEFWDPSKQAFSLDGTPIQGGSSVIAHAECGLGADLEMA